MLNGSNRIVLSLLLLCFSKKFALGFENHSLKSITWFGEEHVHTLSSNSSDKKLPMCTPEQEALYDGSMDCAIRGFGPSSSNTCPSDCCCDRLFTEQNGTRSVGTVGSCFLSGTRDRSGKLIELIMLPISPLEAGEDKNCSKTTASICHIINEGCRIHLPLRRPKFRSRRNDSRDVSGAKEDSESSHLRNVALLSICVSLLVIFVIAAALWFIVLPWMRGGARSTSGSDSENIDQFSRAIATPTSAFAGEFGKD